VKRVDTFFFLSLLFTALAMAASLAHLYELPHKIRMPAREYLVVQQIYRGWSLLGIVVFGSLLSTLVLTVLVRGDLQKTFAMTLTALLCIVGAQVIFWVFTYPVNQQTQNWTLLPENWAHLRSRWEYSHAAGAALNLTAFISLTLAARIPHKIDCR
jgi:hypothetical protein